MAKQEGYLPVRGTLGNLTFTKDRDGHGVKRRGGVSGSRIATDPIYQRVRENGAEFGRAGKASRVLRTALRLLLLHISDSRMIARLVKEMMRVIKSDAISPRGFRNVMNGEVAFLQGFEFNANSNFVSTLFAPFSHSIERPTGKLAVDIPAFVPSNMVTAPVGATHFKITAAAVEVDFTSDVAKVEMTSTAELALDSDITQPINLVNNLPPNSDKPLFLVLGIKFLQVTGGRVYPLYSGAFNAAVIVGASRA